MIYVEGPSPYLVGILFFCILGSCFFSAAETALASLNKMRLRNMVEDNVKNADKISKLLEDPNQLLCSILIGNNLVNNGAAALTTTIAIQLFGGNAGSGATIATAFITIVILIFGEITPKTIATQNSEKVALWVVNVLVVVVALCKPFVAVLRVITGGMIRLFGANPDAKVPIITEAELKTIVNVSHEEGVLEMDERMMINNIFSFGESRAKDVMTPRTNMVAVSIDVTYEEFVELIQKEGVSRIPVYQEDMDDIVGILYVKDIFFVSQAEFSAEQYMREPYFTYESKPIDELFAHMRSTHLAVSIVLDEYGGTAGLVTMEDIVEEVMGEIEDEYDHEDDGVKMIKDDEFLIDGSLRLEDFNQLLDSQLYSDEVDTIAGYVLMILGNFPVGGEVLKTDGLKIVVEEMEKNRIAKLRIYTHIMEEDEMI